MEEAYDANSPEDTVHGTQRRLKELEESSSLKFLTNSAEEQRGSSVEGISRNENWKPISERLEEEIKKERDLMKPKRPPPPPIIQTQQFYNANPFGTQAFELPSWEDESTVDYYKQVPSYQPPRLPQNDSVGTTSADLPDDNQSTEFTHESRTAYDGTVSVPTAANSNDEHSKSDKGGLYGWTAFNTFGQLPQSESGFLSIPKENVTDSTVDPFAPIHTDDVCVTNSNDPFEVMDAEQIIKAAKEDAHRRQVEEEIQQDMQFFKTGPRRNSSKLPVDGFEDNFVPDSHSPSPPLFDEDDSEPLQPFYQTKAEENEWDLYIRYPIKKRLVGDRCWKQVYVKMVNNKVLQVFNSRNDMNSLQEFSLQPTYCLTAVCLQQYDAFGKIHATRLQHVIYKERVGIRPGQIPKLVEGQFTKLGMPLEHASQTVHLIKFGSLDAKLLNSFVWKVEDALFRLSATRLQPATYRQDEVQIHCYDEYIAAVSAVGLIKIQKARVRLFCLAFLNGMPWVEIGLNDRRRQGMEVVRRKDIMPMHTERWIRFEDCEFHSTIDNDAYDRDHVIRLQPLDACFFEIFRFRVRPPKQKQLPLSVRAIMNIVGSKIEIRIECMVAGYSSRKAGQVPCEDIQIRFPIPEAWIYFFREERYWGYGSVHAKLRRPGKVKNIRDRFMGIVQPIEGSLMEVAIGDAKYEHVYRSIVWRIPRLPEKNHEAYKTHLFNCRFELTSYDMMPEAFVPTCDVEFTMPIATVSNTVVRSVSVDHHEDPEHVEKWVRYLSKYSYAVDIDYVQSTELDVAAVVDPTVVNPEAGMEEPVAVHRPEIDSSIAKELHEGYRLQIKPKEVADEVDQREAESSSDDDEGDEQKDDHFPVIQINAADYSY